MAVSVLAACHSPERDVLMLPTAPTSTVPMGSDFTLAPGESVVFRNSGMTFTFTRVVSDSRCPTAVTCVWAGSAIIAMRVVNNGTNSDFTLETVGARRSVVVNNYLVHLTDVTPYPDASGATPPASFRAILQISRP